MTLKIRKSEPIIPNKGRWIIIRNPEEEQFLDLKKTKEILKATAADKEALETDLNNEIATLEKSVNDFKWDKKVDKKTAGKLRYDLAQAQKSINDANLAAVNEKTKLLKELRDLNAQLKNPIVPAEQDIKIQIDAIKGRLNYILEVESRDVQTVLEQRLKDNLTDLNDKDLILTEEEKRVLDYAAGYYYWHDNGRKDLAKRDKEALDAFITANKANIKSNGVLFTANIVFKHFNDEENHAEAEHKYLEQIANLNNEYSELDKKYKDKDAELVNAQDALILKQEEKDKLSDLANKKYTALQSKLNSVNDNYTKYQQQAAKDKKALLAKIGQLRTDIADANISNADKEKKIDQLNTLITTWEDDTLDAKSERDIARTERDKARTDLTAITNQRDRNGQKINDEAVKINELAEKIGKGLIKLDTQTIKKELLAVANRLKA